MIVNFLLILLGIFLFLFIFWKRLKDDYSSNIIFASGLAILLGLSLGLGISKIFLPPWFFWMAFAGSLLGMLLMIFKYKLKFYETFESLILATIPLVSIMFFKDSVTHSSLHSFLAFAASLILIFLSYWFDLNYKSFTWYKSGKIGFAGLSIGIVFFLARTLLAIFGISMLSFVGRIEPIFSGIACIIFIGLLINLGRGKE